MNTHVYFHYLPWTDADKEAVKLIFQELVDIAFTVNHGICLADTMNGEIILAVQIFPDDSEEFRDIQSKVIKRCEEIQRQTLEMSLKEVDVL